MVPCKTKRTKDDMNYYIDCITKKYVCFSGRARRKEYWMFALFNFIAALIVGKCDRRGRIRFPWNDI